MLIDGLLFENVCFYTQALYLETTFIEVGETSLYLENGVFLYSLDAVQY